MSERMSLPLLCLDTDKLKRTGVKGLDFLRLGEDLPSLKWQATTICSCEYIPRHKLEVWYTASQRLHSLCTCANTHIAYINGHSPCMVVAHLSACLSPVLGSFEQRMGLAQVFGKQCDLRSKGWIMRGQETQDSKVENISSWLLCPALLTVLYTLAHLIYTIMIHESGS